MCRKIKPLAITMLITGKKTNGRTKNGLRKTWAPNKIGKLVLKIAGRALQMATVCWFFRRPTYRIPITRAKVTPIPPKLAKPL